MRLSVPAIISIALAFSCAEEPEDGRDDPFLSDGKADGGIQEGTPEAAAVLRVANELSYTVLRNQVTLSSKAAHAIVAVRNGMDGVGATSDDVSFVTLQQLDDVSYVGPISLNKMLSYAESAGWVMSSSSDPFSSASCTGAPMTTAQALTYFAPAATEATLAPFHVAIRTRRCNTSTGCASWEPGQWNLQSSSQKPSGGVLFLKLASGGVVDLSPRADLCNPNQPVSTCGDITSSTLSCSAFSLPMQPSNPCGGSAEAHLGTGGSAALSGLATDHCARLHAHASDTPTSDGSYSEYDAVMYSKYGSSSCVPLTCSEAGTQCGTISDGCGGTLDCGGCSTGTTCSSHQCVATCQCTGGRVCCPGSSDCWDACF